MRLLRDSLFGMCMIWGAIIVFCFILYFFGWALDILFHLFVISVVVVPAILWIIETIQNKRKKDRSLF